MLRLVGVLPVFFSEAFVILRSATPHPKADVRI